MVHRIPVWTFLAATVFAGACSTGAPIKAADAPLVERYLTAGTLAEGQRALTEHLSAQPRDDQARMGLGVLQFLRTIELLAQDLYRFGLGSPTSRLGQRIPLVRLGVPVNPNPVPVKYEDMRQMLQKVLTGLTAADATLAEIRDEQVSLPLHFGLLKLDLNGDGKAAEGETVWRLYAGLNRGLRLSPEFSAADAEQFLIRFDRGDVDWLRGYCHLLSAMCEVALAYNAERFFAAAGPLLFEKSSAPAIPDELQRTNQTSFEDEILDAVTVIHLSQFPLQDQARMKSAHAHLLQVVQLSRSSWRAIQAEEDNDREWLPNSRQQCVIPNVSVSAEMISGWHGMLAEVEDILQGRKLLPHWRLKPEYGINLRRVFLEPRDADLVLWAQGMAAVPYTERGAVTSEETWFRLWRVFGGEFVGFALWFN